MLLCQDLLLPGPEPFFDEILSKHLQSLPHHSTHWDREYNNKKRRHVNMYSKFNDFHLHKKITDSGKVPKSNNIGFGLNIT